MADMEARKKLFVEIWETHLKHEFDPNHKSTEKTMATMVTANEPFVNHVPTMIGGMGHQGMAHFYDNHFIHKNPQMDITNVTRVVGEKHIVDEMVIKFVHDQPVDWMLPSTPPTGKTITVPAVAVIGFEEEGGEWKMISERIYWDQASVLAQIGQLDASKVDATGAEQAQKVLDPESVPFNELLKRNPNSADILTTKK